MTHHRGRRRRCPASGTERLRNVSLSSVGLGLVEVRSAWMAAITGMKERIKEANAAGMWVAAVRMTVSAPMDARIDVVMGRGLGDGRSVAFGSD